MIINIKSNTYKYMKNQLLSKMQDAKVCVSIYYTKATLHSGHRTSMYQQCGSLPLSLAFT